MTKLTTTQAREVLPPKVFKRLEELKKKYRTRNVHFLYHAEGQKLYLEEDFHYEAFYGENTKTWRMKGEWNMTAGGQAIEQMVAKEIPLKPGTWILEHYYFLGKPTITVHHWGILALGGGKQNETD